MGWVRWVGGWVEGEGEMGRWVGGWVGGIPVKRPHSNRSMSMPCRQASASEEEEEVVGEG